MVWYEVIHTFFISDDLDSEIDNEILLTTTKQDEVAKLLHDLDEATRQEVDVITYAIDPRDGYALAMYDGEPELNRISAPEWLERV